MPVHFTFINFLIQCGAKWWKTATRFALNKTKSAFLSLLTFWLQSKHKKTIDCTNIILSVNNTSHMSAILLQNAFETTSPFTDAWLTAYQVSNIHNICYCCPIAKLKGHYFQPSLSVSQSVCLWPALLPFNLNRFWWNLVTRTLLWSSLAAIIIVQIGRRGTVRRLFENFKKFSKITEFEFQNSGPAFLRLCLLCIVKKFRLDSNKTDGGDTFWSLPLWRFRQ